MSETTQKFERVVVNKKEFHASKKRIALNLVDIAKIVVSNKFTHNDQGYKYFIDYLDDNVIRPLCAILPQMSGYIKYFDDDGKNNLR